MEQKDPLVSIVIPVYNCEKYIGTCIESITNQSYKNLEIIIINDGSSDRSGEIIKEKYAADPRVKYIEKENEGVSITRNLGIELSSGELITFIDGDDFIASTFIESALNYINEYNLVFVLGGTQRFTGTTKSNYAIRCNEVVVYENNLQIIKQKVLSNGIVEDRRLDTCFTSGPVCKVFMRDSIETVRFKPELKIGEDTVFNLEVLDKCKRIGVVPDIWYFYRTNEESATNAYNPGIKTECEKTLKILQEILREEKKLEPYLKVRAIQQFHGVLVLFPMHCQSKMSYFRVRKFIRNMLEEEPWKSILCMDRALDIHVKGIDKVLVILCSIHAIDLIILAVKIRQILKSARRGKNGC